MSDQPTNAVPGKVDAAGSASNRFQRAAETFEAVRSLAAAERERALLERCGDDAELLVEVRSLLAFHDKPSETLDTAILRTGVGATIGRYRIADVLGEGGMGTVYLAVQEEPVRREVALKVIKLGMDTRQVVRRFEAERQAIAQMEHPHVARVLDAGSTSDGRPYFVMELVRGQPIASFCDARRMPLPARLRLFLDVCAAVQHAHQKGVIHRDLKPSNILVGDVDGRPVAKVIDFGIAKALSRPNAERAFTTTIGDAVGTPDYMSPEQAGGGDVDVRSDVYALGVILYELLVGMTPLRARLRSRGGGSAPVPPLDELRRIVREEDPLRAIHAVGLGATEAVAAARSTDERALLRSLRGDLEAIVMKALSLAPARRYATVAALADDLERLLRDEPVGARAPSATYTLAKFARRHTVSLVAAGMVVAAILIGLVLALVGFEQARRDRDIARTAQARETQLADEVRDELFLRDIDRGRLRGVEGNLTEARDLLWTAHFARPDSIQARWALRELMWSRGPFVYFWLENLVRCVAALPDEGLAVAGCEFRPPALIDGSTGVVQWFDGPAADVLEIAASPDGSLVATTDGDGRLTLWDRRAMRVLREIPLGPSGRTLVTFDGPRELVLAGIDGEVRRLRLAEAGEGVDRWETLASSGAAAIRIARSTQGHIAVGTATGKVVLLDPPDDHGMRSERFFQPHDRIVNGVAFNRACTALATSSTLRDYAIHDLATLHLDSTGRVFPGTIQDIAFAPDDSRLLIPGWWDTLAVDPRTGDRRTLTALLGTRLSVSPGGGTIVFGGSPRTTCAMLLPEERSAVTTAMPERDLVPYAFNLADGSALCVNANELCGVYVTGPDRGKARWSIPNQRARFAVVSPDGTRVGVLNADRTVRVLSVPDGRELAKATNAIIGEYGTITFDRSGDRLAFVTRSWGVRIIDLALGTECIAVNPLGSEILGIAFDPRGDRLAVCERSGVNRIFSLYGPSTITCVQLRGSFATAFSADGETLLMGLWAGDLLFWDPDTNEERISRGHSAFPSRAYGNPVDPDYFLTCSDDGTVRVWHRRLKQDLVSLTPFGPRQAIRHVEWSRDGTRFYVVGPDRSIRTYSIPDVDRLIQANEAAEEAQSAARRPI